MDYKVCREMKYGSHSGQEAATRNYLVHPHVMHLAKILRQLLQIYQSTRNHVYKN